jgi:hypothetical protein
MERREPLLAIDKFPLAVRSFDDDRLQAIIAVEVAADVSYQLADFLTPPAITPLITWDEEAALDFQNRLEE